jgi:hypothetical protein
MTALDRNLGLENDLGALPGLETVTEQLAGPVAVLRAEQARRQAGIEISRPAWMNLVFTGGPGTGRSRAARAVARIYHDLGLLTYGRLIEIAAADVTGTTVNETRSLVGEAIKPTGDLVMISDAHTWRALPDGGQHVLRCLYDTLTEARQAHRTDELAIILAGQAAPLRDLLRSSPVLAARFLAVIDFPGYAPGQLTAIFTRLAAEAGFTLTPDATDKTAVVLAAAEAGRASGNARLAVGLLAQARAMQARRLAAMPGAPDLVTLSTMCAADIPEYLRSEDPPADDHRPGQYL